MILRQEFKTSEGVNKRCRFENAHSNGLFRYQPVRYFNGEVDRDAFDGARYPNYTWRIERVWIRKTA
jgi:hypothetical protein